MSERQTLTRESVQDAVWQALLTLPVRHAPAAPDPELALVDGGLDLDSVALVELIAALEERLEFQFHDTDLRTQSFRTVGSLSAVVAARLGVRA